MKRRRKVMTESDTRKQFYRMVKEWGGDPKEANLIFDKYDKALAKCKDPAERKQISYMGLVELHKHYNCRGALVVDGIELIPAQPGWADIVEQKMKRLVKL